MIEMLVVICGLAYAVYVVFFVLRKRYEEDMYLRAKLVRPEFTLVEKDDLVYVVPVPVFEKENEDDVSA